jgi:16S rRNA (guanine966-N2)-methyltransferase
MRVVGGKLRSRPLAGPKSNAVRPTSDRLREALFNILMHSYGDPVTGARVLDLFAGTGALGIEAISRGAAYTLFVDDGVGRARRCATMPRRSGLAASPDLPARRDSSVGASDQLFAGVSRSNLRQSPAERRYRRHARADGSSRM